MNVTTISTDQHVATLVNVFTVSPDEQETLIDLLVEATDQGMRHRPGFVSANIHASLDGTKVVNYAQWSTPDDFQAMLDDGQAREHMAAAGAMATAEPNLYRVASVHHA